MTASKVQLIGKRKHEGKNFITAYFAYEDKERVEGISILTFTLFENSRTYNIGDLKVGAHYDVVYHRSDRYYNVDEIRAV